MPKFSSRQETKGIAASAALPKTGPFEAALEEATDFILTQIENPVDVWAVAATLESRGQRDIDALEKYGKADIFDLAGEIYARCRRRLRLDELAALVLAQSEDIPDDQTIFDFLQQRGLSDKEALINFGQPHLAHLALELQTYCQKRLRPAGTPEPLSAGLVWRQKMGRFVKFYGRGVFFTVPMMLQVITVLVFGFGLWASLEFNEEAATTVVVGTILSFLITGGFVQAIGRLGLFYAEQKSYLLAREVVYRLIRIGLVTVMGIGLIWYASNLLIPLFPQRIILVSLVYYLLLSTLWLLLAVLYTLQERLAVVVITLIGLMVIGWVLFRLIAGLAGFVAGWLPWVVEQLLTWAPAGREAVSWGMQSIINLVDYFGLTNPYRGLPWNIYAAQWIGLTVAILLTFLWGHRKLFGAIYWLMQQQTGYLASLKLAHLPRSSIVTFSVSPYFVYGFLYFSYLFMDRLIGWTTADQPLPLFIWFRTPYELGLDWALLSLLLTIAVLEYTINEFGAIIQREQKARKAIGIEILESQNSLQPGQDFQRQDARAQRFKKKILNLCVFAPLNLCVKLVGLRRSFVGFLEKSNTEKGQKPGAIEGKFTQPLDRIQETPHPLNDHFNIKTSRQIQAHNNFFVKFYIRQLLLLTAMVALSITATYFGVLWFRQFDNIKRIRDFFANPVTFYVFYWAVIGYSLLVYSMLNNVFFFFLSRPRYTLRAIGLGLIINMGIGFILSRMVVYWYSVIGMTLGAVVIAGITTWYALRVLKRLDYYYYSAY